MLARERVRRWLAAVAARRPAHAALAWRVLSWSRTHLGPHRLRLQLALTRAPRLVVGAQGRYEPGWIPTEMAFLDLRRDADWRRFLRPGSVRAVLAEHVWEHLTPEDGRRAAAVCFRYLAPGGYLRAAVPDGWHPDSRYRAWVEVGGCGPMADDHRVLYNHRSFAELFTAAGFEVSLLEYHDDRGVFHAVDWDPADGLVRRSRRFDDRRRPGGFIYTSLILDARKPAGT